ncbi:unnamed protein product [Leptidea sinapis]|uniref:Uncharacterized protein n=1 Tax=Leptidea sinapis TaxID=189913 RepID=A0A5E4PLP5_9NEOP|nr:unnamed protein product [Leptidea sinapis]
MPEYCVFWIPTTCMSCSVNIILCYVYEYG